MANGIISINTSDFAEVKKYADTLRKHDSIKKSLEYTGRMLQKYEEYID